MLLQLNASFRIADCVIRKVFIIRKNALGIKQSITTYTLRIVQCVIVLTALLISHSIMLFDTITNGAIPNVYVFTG